MNGKLYFNLEAKHEYEGFMAELGTLPVSFVYGNKHFKGFPSTDFTIISKVNKTIGMKVSNVFKLEYDDNLDVIVDTAFYPDFGAYEWTIFFENNGKTNTGVIRDVCAADMLFTGENPVLKGILGDHENQYKPYEYALSDNPVKFRSDSWRPTHVWFPYFNLEHGNGGTLIALGWGGTFLLIILGTHIKISDNRRSTYIEHFGYCMESWNCIFNTFGISLSPIVSFSSFGIGTK